MVTACRDCPLRHKAIFETMTPDELAFMERFKVGERVIGPGVQILAEGEPHGELYTVLDGMGLKYKMLEDGSRQVLRFVLPGDFLGLQAGVMDRMGHSVDSRTEMTLCVFRRAALWELFAEQPGRGFDLTWLAAMEEHFLGHSMIEIGRMSGLVRVAHGLLRVHTRAVAMGLSRNGRMPMPFVQQDLADALGLSLVHTNKLLRQLRELQALRWTNGTLHVLDEARLRMLAKVEDTQRPALRPLI